MAANPEHYGLQVQSMSLRLECGDHTFERNGLQEGPCVCPVCGRRFVLTWSVNVEPWQGEGEPPSLAGHGGMTKGAQ